LQLHPRAQVAVAGQAPGRKVHESAVPFQDASGDRLRDWMGIDAATFYDATRIAILPMGFCYPGSGKTGDVPPRPECAATWRVKLLEQLANVGLTLVNGQYAQAWHFGTSSTRTLTDTVCAWREYSRHSLLLPHPSPRNRFWLKRNPWFSEDLLPELRRRVSRLVR
jgi:uracil-DNA glycosylase